MLARVKHLSFLVLYGLTLIFAIIFAARLALGLFNVNAQWLEIVIVATIVLVLVGLFTEVGRKMGLFQRDE